MSEQQNPQAETISLFFSQGTSDKEYRIHLKPSDSLWLVEIQYGRRGSALKSALKTKDPIDYAAAKKAYEKILAGQLKDGYTPSATGQAYQDTPRAKLFTGVLPQLLNSVEEEDFPSIVSNDQWMVQEKFDGQRLLTRRVGAVVEGMNRDGLLIAIPKPFEEALRALACKDCVIDGEWLGERYAAFDLLELDGVDLRTLGAKERKSKLDALLASAPAGHPFVHAQTAFGERDKQALHDQVKAHGGEGVVAKRIDAPYRVGRPNSGGDQLKRKFIESATVRITGQHATKRSVSFSTKAESGAWVERGSVTIPSNHAIPNLEDIVEVHYLYAYLNGSLYQTQYKGPRVDQGIEACVCSQLKFKSDGPATAPRPKARV